MEQVDGSATEEWAWRPSTKTQSQSRGMVEEEAERWREEGWGAVTPQTTGWSCAVGPQQPAPLPGHLSNWWKGQLVRSHTQISLRTSEATCQLLPIVGLVIEMWTVLRMEYDYGPENIPDAFFSKREDLKEKKITEKKKKKRLPNDHS